MEMLCEEPLALLDNKIDLENYIRVVCGGKDLINFATFTPGEIIDAFNAAREWANKFRRVVAHLGEDAPRIICEGARVYIYYSKA